METTEPRPKKKLNGLQIAIIVALGVALLIGILFFGSKAIDTIKFNNKTKAAYQELTAYAKERLPALFNSYGIDNLEVVGGEKVNYLDSFYLKSEDFASLTHAEKYNLLKEAHTCLAYDSVSALRNYKDFIGITDEEIEAQIGEPISEEMRHYIDEFRREIDKAQTIDKGITLYRMRIVVSSEGSDYEIDANYDHNLLKDSTRIYTEPSGGSGITRHDCYICDGTGLIQYYYGSSDWEAALAGHDASCVSKCWKCDGKGYYYDDGD